MKNQNKPITPAMIFDARFACLSAQNSTEYAARLDTLAALEAAFARQCARRRRAFPRRISSALKITSTLLKAANA